MARKSAVFSTLVLLTCLMIVTVAGTAVAGSYRSLKPGQPANITQSLRVNVVLVGFSQGDGAQQVDEARLLESVPADFTPLQRGGQPGLLRFTYKYNVVWANRAFENRFFAYMKGIAVDKPLTSYQAAYNDQAHAILDITSNCWIDAPSVESWLARNAKSVSVDSGRYTVFLINWYGRPDFRFHVYTKTNEPDPDTGLNIGAEKDYTKIIAWGGTPWNDRENPGTTVKRTWFCDLSAGPDAFTGSWNVDSARLGPGYISGPIPTQGPTAYRIPPVWEYGNTTGYRPFDDLTGDLAKLTGDVAVKGLFTSNMVFTGENGVSLAHDGIIPARVNAAVNGFDYLPGTTGSDFLRLDYATQRIAALEPWRPFGATYQEPMDTVGELHDVYLSWLNWWFSGFTDLSASIYPDEPDNNTPLGDLMIYVRKHQALLTSAGSGGYQIPVIAMSLPSEEAAWVFGLGYFDPATERPFSYVFTSPDERAWQGYGYTGSMIHEFGHNLGLDHPHDTTDVNARQPRGATYYQWAGSEVNSMMSYIDLNWDFSQFDRDNIARNATAGYLTYANLNAERVGSSSWSSPVRVLLQRADDAASVALDRYRSMDYGSAARHAKEVYGFTVLALRFAGLSASDTGTSGLQLTRLIAARPLDVNPGAVSALGR